MKRIISLITAAFMLCMSITTVGAYYFPEPDWGSLLRQREKLVNQNELELYTEGRVESAPYYGARLEPRGGAYIGMITETSDEFKPLGSYLTYIESMDQKDLYVPANSMLKTDNTVATIGWTVHNLDEVNYDKIRATLDNLSRNYSCPMYIRFANEMNESALGNDPDRYIEVFRNVANIVHEYPNFAVVWSPIDLGALDRPYEYYYPGDEYVDWVGLSCYSIKYFLGNQNTKYTDSVYFMTGDYAWATNRVKPMMEFMEKNNINKPVMISEGGVPTNNKFGKDLQWWSAPRMRNMLWYLVMKYPQIKMINYFNNHMANENERYDMGNYGYAKDIFKEAAAGGMYIRQANGSPEFVFAPANDGETLISKDGIVKLYAFAHQVRTQDLTVNYSIDGAWYHSSNTIPYICRLDISGLVDGRHELAIWAGNMSKSYTFYKTGPCIRFGLEPDASTVEWAINNGASDSGDRVKVTVNGSEMSFDQPPIIVDGRTLVPLRAIFEAFGAQVDWNGDTRTVMAVKDNTTIKLKIGEKAIEVNGEHKKLDAAPQVVNDRTLVPVRAVSEALGCMVDWNGDTRTVIIKS